jgi:hypothetical protein
VIRRYKFALLTANGIEIVSKVVRAHSYKNAMKRRIEFPPVTYSAIAKYLKLPNGKEIAL